MGTLKPRERDTQSKITHLRTARISDSWSYAFHGVPVSVYMKGASIHIENNAIHVKVTHTDSSLFQGKD